jgi:prepilin-type N-terminal cleavage/methylation domain-containing protein
MIRNERGFTIVEVLVAVVIITVGLVAVAAGMHFATGGVATGQQQTVATFLAEQRLEDVKALATTNAGARGWARVTSASFPAAEGYGTIASHASYRRTTAITTPAGFPTQKVITVSVSWRPVAPARENAERSVTLSTLLASRD